MAKPSAEYWESRGIPKELCEAYKVFYDACRVIKVGGVDWRIFPGVPATDSMDEGLKRLDEFGLAIRLGFYSILLGPNEEATKFLDSMQWDERRVVLYRVGMEFARSNMDGGLKSPVILRHAGQLLGDSPLLNEVRDLIRQAALRPITVVLEGDTGTGKELVARLLHNDSDRREQPFVPINCAAVPETLMESTLFGHERGAFTGAVNRHHGVFEQANHGTLFLDEITELQLHLQAKLLRVLQEGKIRRVGGKEDLVVDVRVVAATNKGLLKALAERTLRQDLFYRLDVVRIHMPSLRDRPEDIVLLAQHFLLKTCASWGINPLPGFSPEAIAAMRLHSWPGNVRELEACVTRALVKHTGGVIAEKDLGINGKNTGIESEPDEAEVLKTYYEVQRGHVLRVLEACNWNRTHAAKILGVTVRTIRNNLRREKEERMRRGQKGLVIPAGGDGRSISGVPRPGFEKEIKKGVSKLLGDKDFGPVHKQDWPPRGDKGSDVTRIRLLLVARALRQTDFQKRKAAELLGISEGTLAAWASMIRRVYSR